MIDDINKKNFVLDALLSLCPGAEFVLIDQDYKSVQWTKMPAGFTTPTAEQIEKEVQRLQEEYERNKYQRLRAKDYPSITDQLDILYHEGYDGWKGKIDRIKRKYPKPPKNN
jgi:hypothetical protein